MRLSTERRESVCKIPAAGFSFTRELSGCLQSNVRYFVNVLSDPIAIAILFRAPIVPAVLCCSLLCESVATLIAEHITVFAIILMKIEFEFSMKSPLAVPAGIGHIKRYQVLS